MNKQLALQVRVPSCTECRLHEGADDVCVTGSGPLGAQLMVVGKMPNSSKYQAALEADLVEVGIDPATVLFTQALKCRNWEVSAGKSALKACRGYLHKELALVEPRWILALGNEALTATTGHSGITKYRGRVIDRGGFKVVPTISPAAVMRNPGQRNSYMADLRFFAAQVFEKSAQVKTPKIQIIDSNEKLRKLRKVLKQSQLLSFDVETTLDTEFAPNAAIISLAGTSIIGNRIMVWAVPLYHPESPYRRNWRQVVRFLAKAFGQVPKRVAHNGKFDCRWLRKFGMPELTFTFDTMLACHLLDENREKGLKPQATSRLGVAPWGVDTKNLLSMPINEVLEYNALDTYYTYHIYRQVRQELIDQPRLLRIFQTITMPACNILIGVEQRGVWVDKERLVTRRKIAADMIVELEEKLQQYIPDPEETPDWPTTSKGKRAVVNFNPSNWSKWWLFEHLNLPVLERGKEKEDGSEGLPSMREGVMLELKEEHPAVAMLLERTRWFKLHGFLTAYEALLDEESRIHTTFKLAGTVTGRLSSGKADQDKVPSVRNIRGVNLQQVPRDPFARGLFGAPPGYTFVEADFSQIELRVAAFISRDDTMLSLYRNGEDIHAATASWVLGVPRSKVTKEDRKKAKAVNFGFLYGMGAPKFVQTAFEKYELHFSLEEARAIRRAFFEQFRGLQPWHNRQRRLVNNNRRVQSPIGRVRHLPDIDSPDQGVRAEAERQAINSPVQSFGSDLAMLSMVEIYRLFQEQQIDGCVIGTVHDALLFEIRTEHLALALPIVKHTMENLPLDRKFGVHVDIPIIADLKLGTHWGDAEEITEAQAYDWPSEEED